MKTNVEILEMMIDKYCSLRKWQERKQIQADYLDNADYDHVASEYAWQAEIIFSLIKKCELDKETAIQLRQREAESRIQGVEWILKQADLNEEWKEEVKKRIYWIEQDRNTWIRDLEED